MNDALGCSTTKDLGLAVTLGLMPGYGWMDKYGINRVIDPATDPEDIWEFGGIYNYDPKDTAPIRYVSCTSAADVGKLMVVTGLDINCKEVNQFVTTNGQNNVLLETPLWRVYRARILLTEGDSMTDDTYIHTDAAPTLGVPADVNVRAIIGPITLSTLMAMYTIPAGKVAFLYRGEAGLGLEGNAGSLAEFAVLSYRSRRLGGEFITGKEFSIVVGGGATYVDTRSFPDPIPAGADIKMTVEEVSQTMGVWGTFDLLLIDEDYFSPEQLAEFGQPGY
jgi:hypothetical protein